VTLLYNKRLQSGTGFYLNPVQRDLTSNTNQPMHPFVE
ncbi:MAG: hypothetical protein RL737_783, partial [Bacteroidota bacterium]